MNYQNHHHALKVFGESRRADLLKAAEGTKKRNSTNPQHIVRDQVSLLPQTAQALVATILSIFQHPRSEPS